MDVNKLQLTPELMHNWPVHEKGIKWPTLPENVKSALRLQHKEHMNGLNVKESAIKVRDRFPDYIELHHFGTY